MLITSQSAALTAPLTGEPEKAPAQASPIRGGGPPQAVERLPAEISREISGLRNEVAGLRALLLTQNALLEQLARSQGERRVSRARERTLREVLHDRAGQLAEREALPRRAISGAMMATLRELTGVRALGDVPEGKYEQALTALRSWDMPGAIRRIRRRCSQ